MDLEARVNDRLEALLALRPRLEGTRVLLAVSGGRDSVALLHLLHGQREVVVAHLDHALRAESGLDAAFVCDLASSLGVTFVTERVDVGALATQRGWSVEDAARRIRYEFLARAARDSRSTAILTAHTLEDNAETVLLQLLRGTARATGIPARRERIVRPLLETSKSDLETYLLARGATWREDASNTDERFARNWVRHAVMPVLEARFPGASAALARYAQVSSLEDAFLENLVRAVPAWADWSHEPEVLQRRLIRAALEDAGVRVDSAHLEALRAALASSRTTRLSLPGEHTGIVQGGRVHVFGAEPENATLEWPDDVDFSAFPGATLRTRRAGDRIRLPGGTRKLSDVLIDRKVPREARAHIAVVAQGSQVLYARLEPPVLDVRLGVTRDAESQAMRAALALAQEALEAGEVPVGAVVLRRVTSGFAPLQLEDEPKFKLTSSVNLEIVGRGRNRARAIGDMTRHAELEALRDAAATLGTPYLTDCTLVVTLEPCLMCLGAALEARVARIVYAARNPKNGALGGVMDATRAPWTHRFSVRPGVLEREASALLTSFFSELRRNEPSSD